jgi:hypothetical protein
MKLVQLDCFEYIEKFYNKVVLKPALLLKANLALRLFTWRKRQAPKRS